MLKKFYHSLQSPSLPIKYLNFQSFSLDLDFDA